MTFSQREKLSKMYREWMQEENKNHQFNLVDNHETFLAFLSIRGLLREISPVCKLMNAREECEDYERENNYTCDMSNICESCVHCQRAPRTSVKVTSGPCYDGVVDVIRGW